MRIAINCRSILLSQRTGIGRYTYHLIDALGRIDPANDYILHAPKGIFDFKRRLPDFSDYKNLQRYPDYFNQGISRYDVYHFPCPDEMGTFSGKLVVTIHDLIYKAYPQAHTPQTIALTEKFMQGIAAKADQIICISENTRRDLHRYFDIPEAKSTVVYNGVDHTMFYPLSDQQRQQAQEDLKNQLGIMGPFMLFVGTIEPRKNLGGLLEAFALLKSKKIFEGQLVIAGMEGWMMQGLGELVQRLNIEQDILFAGFVSDVQLRQLYNRAEIFVFPSLYEGFGFPILEAFCCGAAVVTSSTSSCGEVAADAALAVDPQDPKAMAEAMERILTDATFKASLQQAGLKRAQEFSFEKTARNTLDVYRRLVNHA